MRIRSHEPLPIVQGGMGIGVSGHRLAGEVAAARAIAGPNGFIAVNVMRALSNSAELVAQACRSGANAACVP